MFRKKFRSDDLRRKAMEKAFEFKKIRINSSPELTTFDDLVKELRHAQMFEKSRENAIRNMRTILELNEYTGLMK